MTPRNIVDVIDAMLAAIPNDAAHPMAEKFSELLASYHQQARMTAPEAMTPLWDDLGSDVRYYLGGVGMDKPWCRAVCDVFTGKVTP